MKCPNCGNEDLRMIDIKTNPLKPHCEVCSKDWSPYVDSRRTVESNRGTPRQIGR